MTLRRSRLRVLMDEFIWVLFERLLTGLRAEVVRLAVVRRRWLAIVSPHPTDRVAVLAGRTETATINIQQEPGERERDEVEIERVVEFEVRLLGRRLAAPRPPWGEKNCYRRLAVNQHRLLPDELCWLIGLVPCGCCYVVGSAEIPRRSQRNSSWSLRPQRATEWSEYVGEKTNILRPIDYRAYKYRRILSEVWRCVELPS